METGFTSGGSFSLLVLADGTTSIYVSKGGGIIGSGEKSYVRQAAASMLALANALCEKATPATSTSPPPAGEIYFYFFTRDGLMAYHASQTRLAEQSDPMSELFKVGHEVIALVTRAYEEEKSRR